jgi:Uma2 family endonuclease
MTKLAHSDDKMTVEEFLAFTETRPDEEKWELIEGEPIMNASPAQLHQIIVANLLAGLIAISRQTPGLWRAIPGIGVRLSEINAPVPDVMIRPWDFTNNVICDDMIVAFEVLSPSTKRRDLRWKRTAYASLPSLMHYVVIAQDEVEVMTYDRASGFAEHRLDGPGDAIALGAVGLSLPLRDIYRDTGILI